MRNAGLYIWSMQDGEMSYYSTFEVSILFVVKREKRKGSWYQETRKDIDKTGRVVVSGECLKNLGYMGT